MKILVAMLAMMAPAHANGIDLLPLYDNAPTATVHHVSRVPTKRKARPKRVVRRATSAPAAKPDPTRVLAAEYRTDEVVRCIAPVRVVGSQDVRETAAEDSAKKAWAEAVRWAHGESYQDITNAQDYQRRCARSSIGEALGQYFSRCEIVATPCRPGMVKGGAP